MAAAPRQTTPTNNSSENDIVLSHKSCFSVCCAKKRASHEEWKFFKQILQSAPASQKLFVLTTFIHISVLLVERAYSTGFAFAAYPGDDAADVQLDETWMLAMMLATAVFMAWFGIESIVKANAFEIGAYVGTSAFLMVRQLSDYVCYLDNSEQDSNTLNCGTPGFSIPAVHVLFVLTTALNIMELVLCAIMVPDLRWTKYKAIGSDNTVRGLYRRYELFSSVRKMDLQFSVLLVITGLVFFSHKTEDQESGLAPTLLLALTELIWDRVGVHAIKRGDEWALYMFWALSVILPMYVCSVGLVSLDDDNAYFDDLHQGQDGSERPDRLGKIAVLAIACVLNRISTVVVSVLLYKDFNSEKYKALQRLFKLGFKKYGVQRLGIGQQGTEMTAKSDPAVSSGSDVLNPLDDSAHAAAAAGEGDVSQTALHRLAAMYSLQEKSRSVSTGSAASLLAEVPDSERPRAPSVLAAVQAPPFAQRPRSATPQRGSVTFEDDRTWCTVRSVEVMHAGALDKPASAKHASAAGQASADARSAGAASAGAGGAHGAHEKHRAFLEQVRAKLPHNHE